jgi:hypothetical protein
MHALQPLFSEHPKLLERLVQQPMEAMAWHADHIKRVADGGGECGEDNIRTLCVVCHIRLTAEQNSGPRMGKRKRGEAEGEGGEGSVGLGEPAGEDSGAGPSASSGVEGLVLDDDIDDALLASLVP